MSFESLTPSQKLVLNLIRINGEISSADISRYTDLRPSTIVYITKALTSLGYIEISKTGTSTSKGGKKPTLLKINPNVGIIVGIEVLLEAFRVSVIDFAGNIIFRNKYELENPLDDKTIIPAIIRLVGQIKQTKEIKKKNIFGIGIALPGIVISKKGAVLFSSKLNLHNFLLKDSLETQLKLPIYVANDANAGALGVKWFPEKSEVKASNIIYLMYNQDAPNIGSGIVINNQIYEGTAGTAGEITLNLPVLKNLIEDSNQIFHNEKKISKEHLIEITTDLKQMIDLSLSNNSEQATYILKNLCQSISKIVAFLVGFMNPAQIVIGGDLAEFGVLIDKYIIQMVREQLADYVNHGYLIPEITISQFETYSVSVGATAVVLRELYG